MPSAETDSGVDAPAEAIVEGGGENASPQQLFGQPVDDAEDHRQRYAARRVGPMRLWSEPPTNGRRHEQREVAKPRSFNFGEQHSQTPATQDD